MNFLISIKFVRKGIFLYIFIFYISPKRACTRGLHFELDLNSKNIMIPPPTMVYLGQTKGDFQKSFGSETLHMTSAGLGEMFDDDTC